MSNTGGVYTWSQTANSNASADTTVNWAEGMAPSAVNNSARGMMASVAKYRDDIAGAIVTGGTSSAYTVSSYQSFDSLADMSGQVIAFSPHTTSGATVTLSVDGLGAKPLRSSPNVELSSGVLIQGTPYLATYNNSDGAFYLQGYFGNVDIPFLTGMDYWDTISPGSQYIFPAGQAISRTTYAKAFARWGTTYGSGDGSTTFNVPDKTGRISAMKEASATRLTSTYFTGNSTALGAVGGSQSDTLVAGNVPTISVSVSGTVTVSTSGGSIPTTARSFNNTAVQSGSGTGNIPSGLDAVGNLSSLSGSNTLTGSGGSGSPTAFSIVQPTIITNYIIRII